MAEWSVKLGLRLICLADSFLTACLNLCADSTVVTSFFKVPESTFKRSNLVTALWAGVKTSVCPSAYILAQARNYFYILSILNSIYTKIAQWILFPAVILRSPFELRRTNLCPHKMNKVASIHLSILLVCPGSEQQSEQGHPDFLLPGLFLQLFQEDPNMFPGQPGDIDTSACSGSFWGFLPGGTCPERLLRECL